MTTINPINQVNATNLQQGKVNTTGTNANQNLSQMKELPSVSLGRDLVRPVETIKSGDKILETAFQAETKSGKATFTLANGTEVFPNVWDSAGGNYTPQKGDIILGYGEVPKDWGISNPKVLDEMEKKGLSTYPDRAVSAEPKLMYETYVGTDGRDFVKFPLKEGETVAAEKKIFPTKFLFAKPGTLVETLEAKEGSGAMAKVGDFQYVQVDAKGNPYVKDIKDLIKRLNPSNEESKGVFATIKETIAERAKINPADKQSLSKLWSETLPKLVKVPSFRGNIDESADTQSKHEKMIKKIIENQRDVEYICEIRKYAPCDEFGRIVRKNYDKNQERLWAENRELVGQVIDDILQDEKYKNLQEDYPAKIKEDYFVTSTWVGERFEITQEGVDGLIDYYNSQK